MDLVVSPYEVYFRNGGAAGKTAGVILYMWNWVPVWNGASVECSVVATGPPTAVFLGHDLEGGDHCRSARPAVSSRSMASKSALATAKRSGAMPRGRQATGGPDVRMWLCCDVPRDGSQLVLSTRELLQKAVWGRASCNYLYAGD